MIPPQLIGLAGKLLGVLALVVALIGLGEWHGRKAVHQQWDAAISRQAMQAAENVIAQAEHTAKIETQFERTKQARAERVRTVEKEVIRYVESPDKKCEVSPELETLVDAISASGISSTPESGSDSSSAPTAGLRDEPAADGLPTSASASGEPPASPDAGLTTAEFLQAYAFAVQQYYDLRIVYHALEAWLETSHAIAKEGAGR